MKRFTSLAAVLVLSAGCSPDQPSPVGLRVSSPSFAISAGDDSDPSAGNYLVRFKGNGIPTDFALRVKAAGGQVIFAHAGVGIAAVSGLDAAGADALAASSSIAAVDADAYTTIDEPAVLVSDIPDEAITSQANPAIALGFARQWNLRAVSAPAAWAAGNLGSPTVRVGIIDTGIDYLAPDLFNKVDLALSKSFLGRADSLQVQANFPGAEYIADLHYHGTNVAAIVSSNAFFRAGVTSRVTLVALKVCTPGTVQDRFRGSCPTSAVLGAVLYAADKGLDVVNMSLGGSFNKRDFSARGGFGPSFVATINSVFNYAHRQGLTVVVAAGNGDANNIGIDLDHNGNAYNAYCNSPHVICVSATSPTGGTLAAPLNIDELTSYSNYGRSAITVAAPGGDHGFFVEEACSGFTIVTIPNLIPCRGRFFNPVTGQAAQASLGVAGTSQATPHVTGLAALIAGQVGRNPSQIANRISKSADVPPGFGGNSQPYGAGRINVARAMGVQ